MTMFALMLRRSSVGGESGNCLKLQADHLMAGLVYYTSPALWQALLVVYGTNAALGVAQLLRLGCCCRGKRSSDSRKAVAWGGRSSAGDQTATMAIAVHSLVVVAAICVAIQSIAALLELPLDNTLTLVASNTPLALSFITLELVIEQLKGLQGVKSGVAKRLFLVCLFGACQIGLVFANVLLPDSAHNFELVLAGTILTTVCALFEAIAFAYFGYSLSKKLVQFKSKLRVVLYTAAFVISLLFQCSISLLALLHQGFLESEQDFLWIQSSFMFFLASSLVFVLLIFKHKVSFLS